jgi:hypothetical protein
MPDYCIDHESTHNYPDLGLMYGYQRMPIRFAPGQAPYSGFVTTNVSADRDPIPAQLGDLAAGWLSQALDCKASAVEVIDAHSGITGRAHVRLFTAGADLDAVGLLEERLGLR